MKTEEEKQSHPMPMPGMYINEISKLFHDRMRMRAEQIGLKNGYRQILMYLAWQNGATQLDLVKASHFTAPTVSITLKNMEEDGIVRRETDEADRRQTRVYLTEVGWTLDAKLRAAVRETEELLLFGIQEEEKQVLLLLLAKMKENMLAVRKKQEAVPNEKTG